MVFCNSTFRMGKNKSLCASPISAHWLSIYQAICILISLTKFGNLRYQCFIHDISVYVHTSKVPNSKLDYPQDFHIAPKSKGEP